MPHMQLQVIRKGALYTCECTRCQTSMYTHEWVNDDHNARRDAMAAGTLKCDDCNGTANKDTYYKYPRPQYAARLSAPGYMDCTDWHYGPNARRLASEVRAAYGVEQERDARGRFVAGA